MRKPAFFKVVTPYVAALAVLVLAALLVAAIFLTRSSLPWIAFLTGVLAAAVLSMVSRASKAEWIIARREAKISSLQDKLAHEIRLRRELELKLADSLLPQQENKELTEKTVVSEISSPAEMDVSSAAQDMYMQSLSEHIAGPDDAIQRILSAIEHNEFRLYGQRIASLSAKTAGAGHYEVLIRLLEEEEGMMPPGAFFPLVEKYGLMPHLDRWVVQHVIEWIAVHPALKPSLDHSAFFINIAVASLGDSEFTQFVQDQLRLNKVAAQTLCFEITETELSLLHDDVNLFARKISDCGCKIALSNFGRDGVLFKPLHEIHADFLKIDGSIILDILRDPADLAQVASIARVAKTIDVKTVAELVESDACIAKLREIGVDYAQGFGISKPSPIDDLSWNQK